MTESFSQTKLDNCPFPQGFLEYINNVLAGGLLSSLFSREEQSEIIAELVLCITFFIIFPNVQVPVMKREQPRMPPTPDNVMTM